MVRQTQEEEPAFASEEEDYAESDPDLGYEEDIQKNQYDWDEELCPRDQEQDDEVTQFVILKIGITELVISSDGYIRKLDDVFSSSKGYALPGSPYRTYPVEVHKNELIDYYVHDLVWRAFRGEPPEGWEVRHNFWETKRGHEFYSNALEDLEIYPITVMHLRGGLPEPEY